MPSLLCGCGCQLENDNTDGDMTIEHPKARKVVLALLVVQDIMIGLILALLPTLKGSASDFTEEFLSAFLRLGIFGAANPFDRSHLKVGFGHF